MKTEELNYTLPDKLIAQEPVAHRAKSRLLVVDRASGTVKEDIFCNIGDYFDSGDCLALNDTRVIRARLKAQKLKLGSSIPELS